jgi:peroxiredoxin
MKQAGADLFAISADAQDYAWSMAQTTGAKYQILSDSDRKVIQSYGILNPNENGGIAHPSIFIVDKSGVIRYLYVGKNPQDRPPDETLIEEIKKVAAAK